jgi:hypothetical protein
VVWVDAGERGGGHTGTAAAATNRADGENLTALFFYVVGANFLSPLKKSWSSLSVPQNFKNSYQPSILFFFPFPSTLI